MKIFVAIFILFNLLSCKQSTPAMFTRFTDDKTGIDFSNTLTETDSVNIFKDEYMYNGGGVGAGDFNGDGLTDLFFAGNMVSSKLYLNKGGFTFQDITVPSGTGTKVWCTGVAVIDINQDKRPDIFVSTASPFSNKASADLLFINQGNDKNGVPVFKESAKETGLNDSSYGTQAAFLDYDLDGDLDVYLCINAIHEGDRNALTGQRQDGLGASQDKLFRNDGTDSITGLPHYTNVSKQAGIQTMGWGLGVIVKDINRDGWPDIYVANDFISSDHLYINNHNGTFSNKTGSYLTHECHNAMGVDMADCNNDGLEDICVVDMLPDDNLRQKTMFGSPANDNYERALKMGYQPQFVRNMLQLNTGILPDSINNAFAFADIGYMAGVAATDWSWSPLWADFDNDGWRDLLITNGYVKDVTDLDFTTFVNSYSIFGNQAEKMRAIQKKAIQLGSVKKPDCIFMNNHNLGFINVASRAGLTETSFANGAVYTDLDNDGDVDIVMNNINDKAFIYQNNTIGNAGKHTTNSSNYLTIKLIGNKGNYEGLGAKVTIWQNGQMQFAEQALQRGYLSSMDGKIYFGIGSAAEIDSLQVRWLYGTSQKIKKIAANQLLVIEEKNATNKKEKPVKPVPAMFTDNSKQLLTNQYVHTENIYLDFNYQFTLPHRYSIQGPGMATADVDGDGLSDVYVGGASRQSGYFLLQQKNGFVAKPFLSNPINKTTEETGVLLFDADNDGDNDLYCVGGGDEFADSSNYQDLFFTNDGKGNFTAQPLAIPNTTASGSCVIGADYDHDGDIDLFIGGRTKPKQYPLSGRSYLLRNDTDPVTKKIKFTDVTADMCPALLQPGMVTAALWTDYDNDGFADLLLTGEFMPLMLFKNNGGKSFTTTPVEAFKNTNGWYNSLCAADFDNDGDMDYVAGNLGLNSKYKASLSAPVTVRYNDFNKDGTMDAFLFQYNNHIEYPSQPRNVITEQIPGIKKRFLYYKDYGAAQYSTLFTADEREGVQALQAFEMASLFIENLGNGHFKISPLPIQAQVAPMFGIAATDIDEDGKLDILAVGNSFAPEALTGRYDASQGWTLHNTGHNNFTSVMPAASGFIVSGDAKALIKVNGNNRGTVLIASRNQVTLKMFTDSKKQTCIPLQKNEVNVVYKMKDGSKRKEEFYYGNSYLSQSGRFFTMPETAVAAEITGISNSKRIIKKGQ